MESLLASVSEDPGEWLMYLRNCDQYMRHLEAGWEEKRAQEQLSQTALNKKDGVIHYQEEQLQKCQQRITQLEIEKVQLAAAASPTVQTPRLTETLTPVAAAEAYTGGPARPTAPITAPPSRTASSSERIPDPKEFDGSRQDLPRFVQQIYGKMNANADRFPLATNRMTYVAGRLTGKAYSLILPKIRYGIPQFVDYPEMLEYLERAFGDPDRVQNAQNKLFQLRQRQMDFSTFFAEFQRLALEAEMPESALVPLLFQGISRELQDMLLHNPTPSTDYAAYTHHLQTLDNRYRQHQQQVARNRTTTRPTTVNNYLPPVRTPATATTVRTTTPATGDPMDLSYARRSQGRKERNECFRCGSADHKVAQCLKPAPVRPAQLREGRVPSSSRSSSPRSRRGRHSPSPTPSSRSSTKGVALV